MKLFDLRRALPVALTMLLLATATACAPDPSDAAATQLVDIGAGLRGPIGLTATTVTPGITNAASIAFDASGRMWVGTASYDGAVDAVYLVDEATGRPVKVLDDLHVVLGLLWLDDELYVTSGTEVLAYSGFEDHSFAGHRTVESFADGVGELNDLAVAPDGRLLLGISSPCDSCTATDPSSAAIVSFEPDGTDLELYASDIRAAVGLAFYPGTDTLLVTMNQRDDLGDSTPGDWLAAVAKGQSWGFPACYGQGGDECASSPKPIAELDTHAAVSGIGIVTGQLGSSVGTAAIVAEWATGKLLSIPLDPAAPTTASTATTFVTGLAHPVAVTVGPDGAVYASDWTSGTIVRIAPSSATS